MSRKSRKTAQVDVAKYTAESHISRAEVVRLIADRVCLPDEDPRDARNRVGHRLGYDIKGGKVARPTTDGFVFGEAIVWARTVWPGKFDGLPVALRVSSQ